MQEGYESQAEQLKALRQQLEFTQQKLKVLARCPLALNHLSLEKEPSSLFSTVHPLNHCLCLKQMAEARISENENKGLEYKGRMEDMHKRLIEAEGKLHEGEELRRKLHNTILVGLCKSSTGHVMDSARFDVPGKVSASADEVSVSF